MTELISNDVMCRIISTVLRGSRMSDLPRLRLVSMLWKTLVDRTWPGVVRDLVRSAYIYDIDNRLDHIRRGVCIDMEINVTVPPVLFVDLSLDRNELTTRVGRACNKICIRWVREHCPPDNRIVYVPTAITYEAPAHVHHHVPIDKRAKYISRSIKIIVSVYPELANSFISSAARTK